MPNKLCENDKRRSAIHILVKYYRPIIINVIKFFLSLDTYLQSPACPGETSLLQTVSTMPLGVSLCNGMGHFKIDEAFSSFSVGRSVS